MHVSVQALLTQLLQLSTHLLQLILQPRNQRTLLCHNLLVCRRLLLCRCLLLLMLLQASNLLLLVRNHSP
jgi:hypothetical protein